MNFFQRLGRLVDRRWKKWDYDTEVFPEIATRAVTELPPSEHLDYLEVVKWCHQSNQLPAQYDLRGEFGNPPITVFRSEQFYIEVLFWVDGTTSIHQHGFSGAFHVLHGSSIHSRYRFEPNRRFNDHLLAGEIELEDIELLTQGAARPIQSSTGLIHSLFHLDRPSVSVVIRTPADPSALPQYAYAKPSLAFNSFYMTESLTRQLQTLELLHRIDHPEFKTMARELIAQSDSIAVYFLLDKVFHCFKSEPAFDEFVDEVSLDHEELIEVLRPVFQERRRELNIIARRGRIRDADHRFFLALLLNVSSRDHILELIASRCPYQSPVESVVQWVASLAQTRLEQDGGKNTSGIELDDSSLLVFRAMLEGLSFDQLVDRMKREYEDEDVDRQLFELRELCDAFKSSMLFKPLFASEKSNWRPAAKAILHSPPRSPAVLEVA